jgi:hypothetical protein
MARGSTSPSEGDLGSPLVLVGSRGRCHGRSHQQQNASDSHRQPFGYHDRVLRGTWTGINPLVSASKASVDDRRHGESSVLQSLA